ncbi:Organ specific protein [Sesbania bispinosa]|nr:Organ specific protein [Sesbania bispinosa]
MPEGIQGLLQLKAEIEPVKNSMHKCDEKEPLVTNTQEIIEKKVFTEEIEPRPNISAYDDDGVDTKKYMKEFEPRPSVTAYREQIVKKFEPRPSVTAYKGDETLNTEFEPRPSTTKYND